VLSENYSSASAINRVGNKLYVSKFIRDKAEKKINMDQSLCILFLYVTTFAHNKVKRKFFIDNKIYK
jgi:hypothetical protein